MKRVLFTLLIAFIGAALGGFIGNAIFEGPVTAGKFSHWRSLGLPEGKIPVSITGGAYCDKGDGVEVSTADGELFQYCEKKWYASTSSPSRGVYSLLPCSADQPTMHNPGFGALPSPVASCAMIFQWEWSSDELVYVVLEDGSVWRWYYPMNLGVLITYVGGGIVLGLIAGIVIAQFLWKGSAPAKTNEETKPSQD